MNEERLRTAAAQAARCVLADLSDRFGFREAVANTDPQLRRHLEATWTELILLLLEQPMSPLTEEGVRQSVDFARRRGRARVLQQEHVGVEHEREAARERAAFREPPLAAGWDDWDETDEVLILALNLSREQWEGYKRAARRYLMVNGGDQ